MVNTSISWVDAVTAPKVKYLGNANFNGSDSLTYVVRDTTGQQGSTPTGTGTASISVAAVNDAPVTTTPGVQSTAPGVPVIFSTANGDAISITDVDAGTSQIWCRMEATNGTLTLSQTAGLNFTGGVGDGTNDPVMSFNGTLAAINSALNGMRFTPNAGFTGVASFVVKTYDWGNTGAGGPLYGVDKVVSTTVLEQTPSNVPSFDGLGRLIEMKIYDGSGHLQQDQYWSYFQTTQQIYEWSDFNYQTNGSLSAEVIVYYSQGGTIQTHRG